MSAFGAAGVAGAGVAVVTINKVADGQSPFKSLIAGGIFTYACVLLSSIDNGMGVAMAVVFLLGAILTHGSATLNFITKVSGAN